MPTLRYALCDVFTSTPLTGNALAVFTGPGELNSDRLQAVAREMNLSETVFVYPPEAGGIAKIRIFTPGRELPFAGHPVLGTAAVVGRSVQLETVKLETGAGLIPVHLTREGAEVRSGRMVQPVPRVASWHEEVALMAALGVERYALPLEIYDNGPRHIMVAVDDVEVVRRADPDMKELARVHDEGVVLFAKRGSGVEARVFVPGAGVPEDPATGSAAGPLAAHACRYGWFEFGATLEIAQGEALGRPARLFATAHGSVDALEAVEVEGEVVMVGRGELRI